jgi:hypothetical protein
MVSSDRTAADWRRAALGRVWTAAVLVAAEVALILVAGVVWSSANSDVDTAAVTLLGVSAIVGIPVLLVVALANLRAARLRRAGQPVTAASRLAVVGQTLAVVRLLGVIVAAVSVVLVRGLTDSFDLADTCTAATAVLDGLLTVLLAVVTGRSIGRAR